MRRDQPSVARTPERPTRMPRPSSPEAKPKVFISYAHQHRPWVEVLERNLELCDIDCFLDDLDIGVGRSWVGRLQEGLSRADRVVLVATPEAIASPRVTDELSSFIARHRDWLQDGRVLIAHVVHTPLPPFQEQTQHADFRDHDDGQYRKALRALVAAVRGRRDKRDPPRLPDGIEVPPSPAVTLPGALRDRIVEWLAPSLTEKMFRLGLTALMGKPPSALEGFPSTECAASAALLLLTGDDDPLEGARRLVELGRDEMSEDHPRLADGADALLEAIARIASTTSGRGLLGTYLQQLERDHRELIPYFRERGAQAILDRVYVRLELQSTPMGRRGCVERLAGQAVTLKDLLSFEPKDCAEDIPEPLEAVCEITGRWVVLGDPGSGKTTLLRHLAWELAQDAEASWVPLYASLPVVVREHADILERQERSLRRIHPAKGLSQILDREAREGRLLVLLDGLDEVPGEDREEVDQLLRGLAHRWPRTPLVVATRPIGYRPPDSGFREVEVLPLDRERRVELLARWFAGDRLEPDWERGREEARKLEGPLWEISGNPLYLTLIALLLQDGREPARHRAQLYDQVFDLLLEGRHRVPSEPMPLRKATEAALRYLALGMTKDNRDAEPIATIEDRLYDEMADPIRNRLERRWRRGMRDFLDALAERSAIIGPHDGEHADWRFWHRSFREALAAQALHGQILRRGGQLAGAQATATEKEAEGMALCAGHAQAVAGDESRWAEPYALLAGRLTEPDRLVRALMGANRRLGLRALATAHGVSSETLREVLELTDKVAEREKVYEQTPDLVGDPERALSLLERLAGETTNGNDLFFIDRAIARVGLKHVKLKSRVERLQTGLYDHLPDPDKALFSRVETRDGWVDLWAAIPAGTFQMGSPTGEGRDDEHPQHLVRIRQPFHMAVTPVTNDQFRNFDPSYRPEPWPGVPTEALGRFPAVNVTWHESMSFCRWLSARGNLPAWVRLPTEAEWEYACRARTTTRYWAGDTEKALGKVGWYDDNSGSRAHAVGEKPANPWGLYDMHGNVLEWCGDLYGPYAEGEQANPTGPVDGGTGGTSRVLRGGCWWYGAEGARSANRCRDDPSNRDDDFGFRVVRPAAPSS